MLFVSRVRRTAEQQWLRLSGLGLLVVVACAVLALQTPPRDHFNGGGPIVILDEVTAETPLDVQALKREIAELEKQEMSHAQARQKVSHNRMMEGARIRRLKVMGAGTRGGHR
jgi:hypothetical protein